jgi:hypothetical protein
MPFFRRDKGGGGGHPNSSFGRHILYRYWKMACENVGIGGIELYGGPDTVRLRDLGNCLPGKG